MIHPTIAELTKDGFNRYELTLATAKCARLITDEYVRQRTAAENALTGTKESGAQMLNMIDRRLADEKAVKNAIESIYQGDYAIVRAPEAPEVEVVED